MLNFIALPRSAVLVNIVILHFLQVTLLLMFQLVTFIILLNEIFLYSSAPLTPMAAPRPLAGGRYEMNSSLIRNNNNKNTHAAPLPLTLAFLAAAASQGRLCALRPRPRVAADRARIAQDQGPHPLGLSRTLTSWGLLPQRYDCWNPRFFSCFNSSAPRAPSLFSISVSALCLPLWASSSASANHCFSLFCLYMGLCPLSLRSASFLSVCPSLPCFCCGSLLPNV